MIRRGLLRFTISTMLAVGATVLTAGAGIAAALYFWTRDDAHRYQLDSLAQTRVLVDAFLEAAQKAAFSVAINADAERAILLPWKIERDFELLIRLNKILSERVNSTPFIDSILLYSPGNRKVLANFGVSDVELYHDPGLIAEIEGLQVPSVWLRTRSQIRDSFDMKNVLSYVVRLPVNRGTVKGYLVLNVDENFLFSTIANANQARLGQLAILDAAGSVISSAEKSRIGTQYGDSGVLKKFSGSQGFFMAPGSENKGSQRRFISYVRDPVRGWIYVGEQNSADLFKKSTLVLLLTGIISTVCLVMGLGLSFAVSRRNWQPVQEELDKSRDLLGQQFIINAVSGKKLNPEIFQRNCRELGLPLEQGPYQVLLVNVVDPTAVLGSDAGDESLLAAKLYQRCILALASDLPGAAEPNGAAGVVALVESGEAVIVLRQPSMDESAAEENLKRWIDRFIAIGEGKDSRGYVFHHGKLHSDIAGIPLSYAEARSSGDVPDENAPKGDRAAETVEKIRAYIDRSYDQQIDLSGMAEKVYVSVPYLCRIFKQFTGTTYFEYLTAVRVEKAKELLRTTRLPIHVVAERTGFLNKRNINRAFHKYLALTPSDYRSRCGTENLSAGTAGAAAKAEDRTACSEAGPDLSNGT